MNDLFVPDAPSILPTVREAKLALSEYSAMVADLKAKAEAHGVSNNQSAAKAVEMAAQSRKLAKKVVAHAKRLVEEQESYVKSVKKIAKMIEGDFQAVFDVCSEKVSDYQDAMEQMETDAIADGKEIVPSGYEKIVTPEGTAYSKRPWKWELQDISQVPDNCLAVDAKQVNALVKAGVREIPGILVYRQRQTIIRT